MLSNLLPLLLLPLAYSFQTPFVTEDALLAPLVVTKNAVVGKYIITLHQAAEISAFAFQGARHLGDRFFAADLTEEELHTVRQHETVEHVETDQHVHAYQPIDMEQSKYITQKNATWGLARVSHRRGLDSSDDNEYTYDSRAGEGVYVYVIDTGVMASHVEFEGRATMGANFARGPSDDCNGHGTHCSGTIASRSYGVAKKAKIIGVKTLDCGGSGTMSNVIAGVSWAVQDSKAKHLEATASGRSPKTHIASMSLGGSISRALNSAIKSAIEEGLAFAVAAGNDDADACNYSPASVAEAITVGASTINDMRAYFSNKGECVDIFAPGLSILSTWIGSSTATNTISGTSMATPHTAGLMAYFSSMSNGKISPNNLTKMILKASSSGVLKNLPRNTVNKLLNNNVQKS